MRGRENCPEALEVDVHRAHVVPRGHRQVPGLGDDRRWRLADELEHRVLRRPGRPVDEILNRAELALSLSKGLADDRGVRLADEIADRGRMPVVAARQARSL